MANVYIRVCNVYASRNLHIEEEEEEVVVVVVVMVVAGATANVTSTWRREVVIP